MLLGVLTNFFALMQVWRSASEPENWKRYVLLDGRCSAEFPAPPQQGRGTQTFQTPHKLKLEWKGGSVYYTLEDAELSQEISVGAEHDILDQMRDKMLSGMRQKNEKFDLLSDRETVLDQVPGREVEFVGQFRMWARFYVKGSIIYTIVAVTPLARQSEEEPSRFLKSFRFESPVN
jgi:hypothetical protein